MMGEIVSKQINIFALNIGLNNKKVSKIYVFFVKSFDVMKVHNQSLDWSSLSFGSLRAVQGIW